MIGDKILNYIVKDFIAEGGMGTVYLCEHETLNRKAAVKILHPEYAVNKEVVERFKREAKTLSELKHPNIVEILDFGVVEGKPFLIMEYIEGQSLDEYISKVTGPIAEEDTIEIMSQILNAVQAAHEKGIVHRDLKPSNVIINHKKKIKIIDFGIAKEINNTEIKHTRIGLKLGTLPYMSPEQIKGSASVGFATDIYSLGVLLFQMVSGKPPYDNNLPEYEISRRIVEDSLPRIKSIYPSANSYFQLIIDKATEKIVKNRYQSCNAFKIAITDLKKKEGLSKSKIIDNINQDTNNDNISIRETKIINKTILEDTTNKINKPNTSKSDSNYDLYYFIISLIIIYIILELYSKYLLESK